MPSLLSDNSGSTISLQYPSSEPLGELRRSHEKTNGVLRPTNQKSRKESFENGFDRHPDSPYRIAPVANGDMRNDSNGLSSLPNGNSSGGSYENRSFRNDSGLSINGGVNGVTENGSKPPTPLNGVPKVSMDRTSVVSINGAQQPTEFTIRQVPSGENSEPPKRMAPLPPISTNPQSTGPLTYNSSLFPGTPTPETPKKSNKPAPHRFSSPPAYPSSNATATSSSANNLMQPPVPPPLQHRHTLQVPKPGPNRTSKDGEDGVFASGRFSPTGTSSARRQSLSLYRRNTRSLHSEMPHEDVPQDEDAMRWAEAIRQKRASKRKRKDEEDEDRVVVGTKVDQNHVNWVTAYNMLTGIRFTVSRTNAKLDRPLTDLDFEQKHKFSFDM
jgi:1-phosphatidylinositol-4-phosphate 5-kinase